MTRLMTPGGAGSLLVLLCAVFLTLVWSAARQKSETIDEGLFISFGAAQVRQLEPNVELTHPPLLRWLAGIPAVVIGQARLPVEPAPVIPPAAIDLAGYDQTPDFNWAQLLFYDSVNDHDRVLFWGRFLFALLAVFAAVLIFREVRDGYGDLPALASAAVFLFTPEVLAHSQWAHSDVAAALATLIVAITLRRTIERASMAADIYLGLALGVAVLAKITSLALVPVTLSIVWFYGRRRTASQRPLRRAWLRLVTISAVIWLVIVVGYLPRPRVFSHEFMDTDVAQLLHAQPQSTAVSASRAVLGVVPLPDGFLKAIVYTKLLADRGQIAFLHGEVRTRGWWYYYPVALVLKYPTPFLALALIGLAMLLRDPGMGSQRKVAWIVPPIVILALALTNHVNIGVRAILPVAPFLALWCAPVMKLRARAFRAASLGLLALGIVSGVAAYPNFLAYFNPLAGGTKAADRWLVDSNLDWGQDVPALAKALEKRNIDKVHLAYFGGAIPAHWGIIALPAAVREPGWYAISRSYLSGWWPPGDPFSWLRERKPEELVGGSIALFRIDVSDTVDKSRRSLPRSE